MPGTISQEWQEKGSKQMGTFDAKKSCLADDLGLILIWCNSELMRTTHQFSGSFWGAGLFNKLTTPPNLGMSSCSNEHAHGRKIVCCERENPDEAA
jgi:hypothetical protein